MSVRRLRVPHPSADGGSGVRLRLHGVHHAVDASQADVYLTRPDDRAERRGQFDPQFVGVLGMYGLGATDEAQVAAGTEPFDVLLDATEALRKVSDSQAVDVLIVPRGDGAAPQVNQVELEPFQPRAR